MPQENGWATGPEHCDEDGRLCPYCGSEDTDSGSLDTQAGQVVESGCECLDCGKTWDQLYNIAGWYHTDEDGNDTLHEDLRDFNSREHVRILREALAAVLPYATSRAEDLDEAKQNGNEDPKYPGADAAWQACKNAEAALEATKEEA